LSAAYRKISEKDKIKTRPKIELYKKKYQQGVQALKQTKETILEDLLPKVFTREATKQSLDKIHN